MLIYNQTRFLRYFLSILLASVTSIIVFIETDKYKISLVDQKLSNQNFHQIFDDLNNDGISEKLEFHQYTDANASVLIYMNDKILGQWNFNGYHGQSTRSVIFDYDSDGNVEVFVFTHYSDSLFLNCFDPITGDIEFENIPVDGIKVHDNYYNYQVTPAGFTDIDGNGIFEFFFGLNSGYSTKPRAMAVFVPSLNRVVLSPESCAVVLDPILFDLDRDGMPEIVTSNMAIGNCVEERQFSDLYGWLMVFTPLMKFKFPPVCIPEYPSETRVIPFAHPDENYLLCYHYYKGNDSINDFFGTFNSSGELKIRRDIDPKISRGGILVTFNDLYNKPYYISPSGDVYNISSDLYLKKISHLGGIDVNGYRKMDLDKDNSNELIFLSAERNEIIICRGEFSDIAKFRLPYRTNKTYISEMSVRGKNALLYLDADFDFWGLQYSKAFIFKFWYLTMVIILSGSMGLLFIVEKIVEFRSIKIINNRNRLSELQLKSVMNQIDPHFTFNLLEAYKNLLDEQDTKRAEFIFSRYSQLLKSSVLNGEKTMIPLKEELEFVQRYMELEQFRMRNRFDFKILINGEVDNGLSIPKMMIHIFVENAIKHGIRHLSDRKGEITIKVTADKGKTFITITDNGIGLEGASKISSFTSGQGLRIVSRMLELTKTLYRTKISYNINDLKEKGQPFGTEVKIEIEKLNL